MRQIEIEYDVPVPMRDGTVLRADVYRPAGEGLFPVIVQRTPYDKSVPVGGLLDFRLAARNGYIVVNQDTRGRAVSDGEWVPWKYEREDGYDTIEWAASLPGSNGKVGRLVGPLRCPGSAVGRRFDRMPPPFYSRTCTEAASVLMRPQDHGRLEGA